jgi:seryl-tRNA synthetase
MSFDHKLEERILTAQRKIQEMTINLENLDREFNQLLSESGLEAAQIEAYIKEMERSKDPIWETLKAEQDQLNQNLENRLTQIKDPKKLQQVFSEKASIQSHWIYVH